MFKLLTVTWSNPEGPLSTVLPYDTRILNNSCVDTYYSFPLSSSLVFLVSRGSHFDCGNFLSFHTSCLLTPPPPSRRHIETLSESVGLSLGIPFPTGNLRRWCPVFPRPRTWTIQVCDRSSASPFWTLLTLARSLRVPKSLTSK